MRRRGFSDRYAALVPRFHDDAIVLRRWDWSETSQIAWLFTRGHGLLRGVAKGAKRPRSAFDGGLEPLTRGEVGAITKPDTDLATLTGWDLREVCWAARTSLEANRIGLFAAGLLASIVTDLDPHPYIFDEFVQLMETLGEKRSDVWLTAARFQWATLVDTGHSPRLEGVQEFGSAQGGGILGFDPHAGEFISDPGLHGAGRWRVRSATALAVVALAEGGEVDPRADPLRVNRFLLSYWTWILGREPRVASLLTAASDSTG